MYQANASQPLVALLNELDDLGYDFIAITPRSHSRVVERRAGQRATDLRDVFGWSLPFERALLLGPLMDSLEAAGAVEPAAGDLFRSALRVATLDGRPFLHSAFPTIADDSVFFGPDTYRFLRFVERWPSVEALAAAPDEEVLGEWAGRLMGLSDTETESYAKDVVRADFEEAGDEDVIRKILGDVTAAGVECDEATIREALGHKLVEARRQIIEASN